MKKGWYVMAGAIVLQGTLTSCSSGGAAPAEGMAASATFDQTVSPFFTTYCTRCHSGDDPPAGIVLAFASEEAALAADEAFWDRVSMMIEGGQMPPSFAQPQPSAAERAALVEWIDDNAGTD